MELKSRIVRGLPMLAVVASLLVPMKAATPAMAQVAKAPGCGLCGPAAVTVSAPTYTLNDITSDQQLAFREKRRSPRPRMDGQADSATAALEKPRRRPRHRLMNGEAASADEQLAFRKKGRRSAGIADQELAFREKKKRSAGIDAQLAFREKKARRPHMDGQVTSATAALEKPRQRPKHRFMDGQAGSTANEQLAFREKRKPRPRMDSQELAFREKKVRRPHRDGLDA